MSMRRRAAQPHDTLVTATTRPLRASSSSPDSSVGFGSASSAARTVDEILAECGHDMKIGIGLACKLDPHVRAGLDLCSDRHCNRGIDVLGLRQLREEAQRIAIERPIAAHDQTAALAIDPRPREQQSRATQVLPAAVREHLDGELRKLVKLQAIPELVRVAPVDHGDVSDAEGREARQCLLDRCDCPGRQLTARLVGGPRGKHYCATYGHRSRLCKQCTAGAQGPNQPLGEQCVKDSSLE
jgi:hypothetical protein